MNTKKLNLLLIISLFTLFSCDKIDDLLTFEVKDTATFTIPSYTGINIPVMIPVPTIHSSASQTFANNKTQASLVKNVSLKEVKLHLESPGDKSFRFLKSIEVFISAEGESEVMLASNFDIPDSIGNELVLTSSNSKLDPFLKKDSYTLRTQVQVREVPGQDVKIKANMTFQVTAAAL